MDYSGIAVAAVMVTADEMSDKSEKQRLDIVRHVVLNCILSYKLKYQKKFGKNVVIACDGPKYWRKKYYQYYKANRKKAVEESTFDWEFLYKCLGQIKQDLIDYFPYKVINVEGAEADDVIACLTKELRTEFGKMEPVVIISSDYDMSQLQKYDNVVQYSPSIKKEVNLTKAEVKAYIIKSTLKGQTKDGIPNIKQADDALVIEDRKRAPSITQTLIDKFTVEGISCLTEEEQKNYERNRTLFDFDMIPKEIHDLIINTYENTVPKNDRMGMMNYLINNRCSQLLNSLEDF